MLIFEVELLSVKPVPAAAIPGAPPAQPAVPPAAGSTPPK
jgi:hypothetical protein